MLRAASNATPGSVMGPATPRPDPAGKSDDVQVAEGMADPADVDCELLVSGSYLRAHKAVLAARSLVLKDLIAQVSASHPWPCCLIDH